MPQEGTLIAANDNIQPTSLSGKGVLYDAAVKREELAPRVQEQIDATESFFEKIFGIKPSDFISFDPAMRVKVFDKRRNPENYMDDQAKPLLERVVANDNNPPKTPHNSVIPQKQAA